ncbi:Mur ligase family protein [Nitrosophilus alvini]|uniref:Mur ligase family protein n=1 Tax=Nitrosophilus alvini TaxID=2714855 RepID=UPI001F1ACBCB|nr:UDP-N-acetylmuramoyl-tripeptide--D-alanyl-D-alanine ligase [Nitrosophilus alvini]
MEKILHLTGHILLILAMGYYLILNLQWYSYRLKRVILHHHNQLLHIFFFFIPLFAYIALREYVWAVLIPYVAALWLWQRKIDKKLVFTGRVKRFFAALVLFSLFFDLLCLAKFDCRVFSTILPLAAALIAGNIIEKILFAGFKKEAKKRLDNIDPTIIAITASYGKTSIKNYTSQILSKKFKTYATPGSVNTLAGILKDINEKLPNDTEIYVVEAGARERGDIYEIATFLNHHYAIIGKIGEQHIEYFKSLERIIATKLELLASKRLKKAFLYYEIPVKTKENIVKFGQNIKNLKADLNGVSFDLEIDERIYHFEAPVLGAFNAVNITAAIMVAKELGMDIKEIQKSVSELKPVEHRLQKIEAGGKTVIDDSFNGNLEGMISSYELVDTFRGRKVLVTPGIVESTAEANEKLAKKIDEVFDLVIITGKLNRDVLDKNIKKAEKIILEDKTKLQEILAVKTKAGDLILFSNDAPSFM